MTNDFDTILTEAPDPGGCPETISAPEPALPPIAGFWRRFAAWLLDGLLLGAAGQIMGLVFSSFFYTLGPYGRLIGLLVEVPYFGILNSKLGGGQTLGKRAMKIAVRNQDNQPIELWRSVARILILSLPALLNNWQLPFLGSKVVSFFVTLLIFGLGGTIFYTMVFNRGARQGIHDLITGTYVVYLKGENIAAFPQTARVHRVISWTWVGMVAVAAVTLQSFVPALVSSKPLASVFNVYKALERDPRFFAVNVNRQTRFSSQGNSGVYLVITVWCKGKPENSAIQEMSASIAQTVFDTEPNIDQYDGMQLVFTSGYDIGIATFRKNMSIFHSMRDWRKAASPMGYSPDTPETVIFRALRRPHEKPGRAHFGLFRSTAHLSITRTCQLNQRASRIKEGTLW